MKKAILLAILIVSTFQVLSQSRGTIKKTKQLKVDSTWIIEDELHQVFQYTRLSVVGDEKYDSYILRVVSYFPPEKNIGGEMVFHPLFGKILMVSFYPDHEDGEFVNFFSCTGNNGLIRQVDGGIIAETADRLIIINLRKDGYYEPVRFFKLGQFDELFEVYEYKSTVIKSKTVKQKSN